MRIILAGHNVDVEALREFRKNFLEPVANEWTQEGLGELSKEQLQQKAGTLGKQAAELLAQDNLTPETISAAYARISRDARPVDELRAIARAEVEKARKSNDRIIFGHCFTN